MKLTKTERVILYRLHEILAELNPDEANDHRQAMSMLIKGYHEAFYNDDWFAEPVNEAVANFVADVLALFDNLQFSHRKMPPGDRTEIKEDDLSFPGFDGNNEGELMGYARFRVDELGHWPSLKRASDFNSHMPMSDIYRRMLAAAPDIAWTPDHGYSAGQIKAILAARKYPHSGEAAE